MLRALALAISTLLSCAPNRTADVVQTPIGPDIAYFGFLIVDAFHDDPHDTEPKTNYADEVAGFTNIADIAVFSPQDNVAARIATMRSLGIKPILLVPTLLLDFIPDQSSPTGIRYELRPDAQARFTQFVQQNALSDIRDDLAAVYIADEPAWNMMDPLDLDAAATIVRQALPGVPVAIVEAAPALPQLVVPQSIDWIGFDHYGVLDPAHDPLWQSELQTLRSKRSRPDQRVIIVMESQWRPEYDAAGLSAEIMASVARSYVAAARNCPETVAILGYTWPGGFDSPDQLGARNLPASVIATYRRLGRSIVHRPASATVGSRHR